MDDLTCYYPRIIARELSISPKNIGVLLTGSTLGPDDIYKKASLSYSDFSTFLANALDYSNDPGLGLRFGRHAHPYASGEVGMASMAAPNLLEALTILASFSRLQANYVGLKLHRDLNKLQIRGYDLKPIGVTRRTQHEVLILTLQNIIEAVLGRPFTEGRYYFSYSMPDYVDRYSELIHAPFEFDAAQTGVDVPIELLSFASPSFHQQLWQQGQQRCSQLMEALKDDNSQVYSQHILSLLRTRPPPLPNVSGMAQELHISERTLTRRLHEEGTGYRQLLNQILKEWACRYLRESTLSVDAISFQLGYQDSANFRRAFKRWLGCSPQVYRLNLEVVLGG